VNKDTRAREHPSYQAVKHQAKVQYIYVCTHMHVYIHIYMYAGNSENQQIQGKTTPCKQEINQDNQARGNKRNR